MIFIWHIKASYNMTPIENVDQLKRNFQPSNCYVTNKIVIISITIVQNDIEYQMSMQFS